MGVVFEWSLFHFGVILKKYYQSKIVTCILRPIAFYLRFYYLLLLLLFLIFTLFYTLVFSRIVHNIMSIGK